MSTNLLTFASTETTMRYQEPYVTEGLNRKLAVATPPWIYRGFKLTTDPLAGDRKVQVQADSSASDHVLIYQTASGYSLTVRKTGGNFLLDLTSYVSTTVIIAIYASYSLGATTSATLRSYTEAEFAVASEKNEVVVLGKVVVPASGAIGASSITGDWRRMAWMYRTSEMAWPQVIKNSGFEWAQTGASSGSRGAYFWEKSASGTSEWQIVTTDPQSGVNHAELNYGTGAVDGGVLQYLDLSVSAGQRLRVRLYKKMIKASTGGSATLTLGYRIPAGFTTQSYTIPTTSIDAAYVEIDKIFEAPSNAVQLRFVGVSHSGIQFGSSGVAMRLDNIQVWVEATAERSIVDGDLNAVQALTSLVMRGSAGYTSDPEILHTFAQGSPSGRGTWKAARRDGLEDAGHSPPLFDNRGNIQLGAALVAAADQARTARILAPSASQAISPYTLLSQFTNPDGSARNVRIYLTPNSGAEGGGLLITMNASYDGTVWQRDTSGSTSYGWSFSAAYGFAYDVESSGGAAFAAWSFSSDSADFRVKNNGSTVLGGGLLAAAASALVPRIKAARLDTAILAVGRTLIMEFPYSGTGTSFSNVRVYRAYPAGGNDNLEITLNAVWDGALWSQDSTVRSSLRYSFDSGGLEVEYQSAGAGTWNDASWIAGFALGYGATSGFYNNNAFLFTNTGTASNPSSTTNIQNGINPKNVCKCWGVVDCSGASPAILEGYNFSAVSFPTTTSLLCSIGGDIDDTNYVVVASVVGSSDQFVDVHTKATTGFRLSLWDIGAAALQTLASSGYIFMFAVFGRQTT